MKECANLLQTENAGSFSRKRLLNQILHKIYHKNVLLFLLNFLVIFAAVSVFQGENFSCDGYIIYASGLENNVITYLASYRFMGAAILQVLCCFNHNFMDNCTLDTIILAVLLSLAVTLLTAYICRLLSASTDKKISPMVLTDAALLISVLNISSANMMGFPECEILVGVGFLLCFLTACLFTGKPTVPTYALSVLLTVAFTAIFQQFYAIFAVLLLTICTVKSIQDTRKGFWVHLKHYLIPAGCYFSAGLIYYVTAKLIIRFMNLTGNTRADFSIGTIFAKIMIVIKRQGRILKGGGYINNEAVKFLLALATSLFFLVSTVLVIYSLIKKRQPATAILTLLAVAAAYCLAFLPEIIENTQGINVRVILGFYSLFFMFTVLLIASGMMNRFATVVISGIFSVILSLFILKMNGMELSQKAGNTADRIWAEQIVYEIDKYENETGIQIEYVRFCDDGNSQLHDMNITWARDYILRIVDRDSHYSVSEMTPEEKTTIFKDRQWTCYDADEQIVFDGNQVFICAY